MIRSKGEAGTGDIVEAVRHMRQITGEIRRLATLGSDETATAAKELAAPLDLVREVAREGRLPVVLFCAGGIATPADAALMMALGAEGGCEARERTLRGLGARTRQVRVPADLVDLDGLVMPGGESTTMTLGIEREGLAGPLRELAARGTPILRSCAGLILLSFVAPLHM